MLNSQTTEKFSTDLLALDTLLDDERSIRETVRRFCDDKIRPQVATWYEDAQLPVRNLVKKPVRSDS